MIRSKRRARERGTILLVVLFIATAIAALAAISSGRVVAEARQQGVYENETRAYNEAFAQLHLALNVINNSEYDAENHNLEIRRAIDGTYGGTAGGDPDAELEWLCDPDGVLHGLIRGTDVRVYRARDYVKRIAALKGLEVPVSVDPLGATDNYFVIEGMGRIGDSVRVVSALVRESEPFSSFVFFQNRHPLGVSGAPRGLIHSNDSVEFYFPDGQYVDSVSAVNGFGHQAGATTENTDVRDGNPEAAEISLEAVDFGALKEKSDLFVGGDGLDAEVRLYPDGRVQVKQYTPPHYDWVEHEFSEEVVVGFEEVTEIESQRVQVGTTEEERTRDVIVGYETQTYTVTVPIYEDQEVEKTRWVPVYELQMVTKTRRVRVFVPYDDGDAGGGTAVGGGGEGVPGEYVWVEEEYQVEENVVVDWVEETYTVVEAVQVGSVEEERTREVPIRETETYTVEVPVYEWQDVEVTREVPLYETNTWTESVKEFFPPTLVSTHDLDLTAGPGTVYVDGRVTRLSGDLNGRLTIVGNEKVRVTGSIRYVDDDGDTAMLHGNDHTQPYERNPEYGGKSTLGVIARDDVLFTHDMPWQSEVNATLMAVEGRVGIDGLAITEDGEPVTDYLLGMTPEEREVEKAYDRTSYRTERFVKDSLRRMGGLISNDRIVETYIRPRSDGTSYVAAGFKRGNMQYDINLLFNPPPNFVEVPRPVVTYYTPVFFTRET